MWEECVFAVMCWPIVKSHYFPHLSWLWQSCSFTPHAMYPVLVDLNVGIFHTFLQAPPVALILMGKTASLPTELLTVPILGKASLVASGSSSARPLGAQLDRGWSHLCFPAAVSSPGMGFWVNCDTSQALRLHEPKLLPHAELILSCLPWQVTASYRKCWLRFRKTKI